MRVCHLEDREWSEARAYMVWWHILVFCRHVILPKPLLKLIPRDYFDPDEPGVLRILKDAEWRKIGITQSLGWEHYEVHGACARVKVERQAGQTDCQGQIC